MTYRDPADFENALIAEMRENGGAVISGPLAGHPLLVMTSQGARSGEARRAILTWTRDDGDYVVAGTAGGSPTAPSWVANVATNPEVSIEVDTRSFEATARVVVAGPERDRLWSQHVERLPWFAEYPAKTGRVIPMVRLTPSTSG
jgi:deazaflavin-dependent oxidoreductase (nitroreductase family)